jgi:rubrerythrin
MSVNGLQQAIEFEREGQRFYADAAAAAVHPLAAKTFASLTVEEIQHRFQLEEAARRLEEEGRWATVSTAGTLEETVRDYFFGLDRVRLRERLAGASVVKALEVALETERRGLAMYGDLAGRSQAPEERSLYESLAEEERGHLTALENVHAYLTDSADWFHQNERQVWNWLTT